MKKYVKYLLFFCMLAAIFSAAACNKTDETETTELQAESDFDIETDPEPTDEYGVETKEYEEDLPISETEVRKLSLSSLFLMKKNEKGDETDEKETFGTTEQSTLYRLSFSEELQAEHVLYTDFSESRVLWTYVKDGLLYVSEYDFTAEELRTTCIGKHVYQNGPDLGELDGSTGNYDFYVFRYYMDGYLYIGGRECIYYDREFTAKAARELHGNFIIAEDGTICSLVAGRLTWFNFSDLHGEYTLPEGYRYELADALANHILLGVTDGKDRKFMAQFNTARKSLIYSGELQKGQLYKSVYKTLTGEKEETQYAVFPVLTEGQGYTYDFKYGEYEEILSYKDGYMVTVLPSDYTEEYEYGRLKLALYQAGLKQPLCRLALSEPMTNFNIKSVAITGEYLYFQDNVDGQPKFYALKIEAPSSMEQSEIALPDNSTQVSVLRFGRISVKPSPVEIPKATSSPKKATKATEETDETEETDAEDETEKEETTEETKKKGKN